MFGALNALDDRTKRMARFLAVARHINALVYLIGQTPEQLPPSLAGICACITMQQIWIFVWNESKPLADVGLCGCLLFADVKEC